MNKEFIRLILFPNRLSLNCPQQQQQNIFSKFHCIADFYENEKKIGCR